jgi:hypothetical protein
MPRPHSPNPSDGAERTRRWWEKRRQMKASPMSEDTSPTSPSSEAEAKRQADRALRRPQRSEGLWNLLYGPMEMLTAPLVGGFRKLG